MLEIITSQISFMIILLLFAVGSVGSLILRKNDATANMWSGFFAILGSFGGILFSILTIIFGRGLSFRIGTKIFPLLVLSFHIDLLSAFFLFVISLIAFFCSIYGIGYVKHFYKKYNIGSLGFFYNLFILGMLLVVTVDNGLFFLVAWEIMSVASFFLVIYDRNDQNNISAGFLYLAMTQVGTAFIILAFLLFYKFTGSFDFETIRLAQNFIPFYIKNIIFVLAVIGFGTKAGIIPFHIWLPSAHPAAPSHVSALMSGVMIKTGIYMMIRFFLDILQPISIWWGFGILIIGSISSIMGVLYALTEHDIKRLLAYHSIENIGIILLGFGGALTFFSLNMPAFALLGLVAALFHILNHAIFKSLLFLSAGSVINETHTRNMEEYGGLIKRMPQTAFFFLAGSMAISALPPFNGFFSEWLTFQSFFQGIIVLDFPAKWIFIISAGALAFTGGLALACFVKVFGVTFLARPRSQEARHAKESLFSLRASMGSLAALSLLFGIFSGTVTSFIERIGRDLSIFNNTFSFVSASYYKGITAGHFSFVSALTIFILLVVVFIVVMFAAKYAVYKDQKICLGGTWDCGADLTPRMEITASGFSRSIITIFKGVLKPSIQNEVEYHDVESRYLPKSRTIILSVQDIHFSYFYKPLSKAVATLSRWVQKIQGGNINVYILYIFLALLAALFLVK